MNVSYIEPLRRAWVRSHRMLFQPFAIRTWLVLGFAAFLSEALVTGHGANYSARGDDTDAPSKIFHALGGVFAPAVWTVVGMLLIAAILLLVIVLLWANSRGRFVFLDGVVRERTAIVEPWKRFAGQGNSLFVWMVLFLLVCAAIVLAMVLPFLTTLAAMWASHEFHWGILGALWMLAAVAVPFSIVVAYTLLFLSDFVIPIMHRQDLGAVSAWRRFLTLLRAHPGSFLFYGLFVLALWLVVGVAVAAVGLSTCCIGFVLFGIPYVSSVILLPALVTFRGLGPEFLAQFGPEYSLPVEATGPPGGTVPGAVPQQAATPDPGATAGAGSPPDAPGGGA